MWITSLKIGVTCFEVMVTSSAVPTQIGRFPHAPLSQVNSAAPPEPRPARSDKNLGAPSVHRVRPVAGREVARPVHAACRWIPELPAGYQTEVQTAPQPHRPDDSTPAAL